MYFTAKFTLLTHPLHLYTWINNTPIFRNVKVSRRSAHELSALNIHDICIVAQKSRSFYIPKYMFNETKLHSRKERETLGRCLFTMQIHRASSLGPSANSARHGMWSETHYTFIENKSCKPLTFDSLAVLSKKKKQIES